MGAADKVTITPDAPKIKINPDSPTGNPQSYWEQVNAGLLQNMKDEGSPEAAIAGGKSALITAGSMIAPELLPEMAGGGVLGFLGRVLAKAGLSGLGAGAGNSAGQAATGENPFSKENIAQTAKLAGWTFALSLPFEAIGGAATTKPGRGAINSSMGVTTRDLAYGNPARGLVREEIQDLTTGDINAYREALDAGKSTTQAAQAAGGRLAAVSQRINELTPRLGNLLNQSKAKIPVSTVIDKPLEDAAHDIIGNPAMGDTEKMAAISKLGELQKSLKEGIGPEATPAELQVIKQKIGGRINWGGTSAVTDDVKGAYRAVYGSLKNAIHTAVPGTGEIDSRLTDLMGAADDLDKLARGEEGGKTAFTLFKLGQKAAGRVLPAATNAPLAIPAGATIGQQLQSKGQPQPNSPTLPFHPGAGLQKP